MLVFESVSRRFGAKAAVDDVNVAIPKGAFIGIIGRSGAGKSTLLRMTNRLVDPSQGRILFEGTDVTKLTGQALRDWRANCAMIFQQFNLIGRLDVLTNVLMGRLNKISTARGVLRLWSAEDKLIALSALEQFDIANLAADRADRLSGGQQQRVAIVRALAMHPQIMLLDEVTSALDPELVAEVLDVIRELAAGGMTMLIATHEMGFARDIANRVCFLEDGEIVEDAPPAELFAHPRDERTQRFLRRIVDAGRL